MTSKLQHRSSGRRLGFWLAVAGLVHAEVLLLVGFGVYLFAPRDADLKSMAGRTGEQESIDVGMIDEDAAREIVADLEKQNEKDKAEEVKKEVESLHPPGQVVDIPAPAEERRPEDARFVSEHDTTVARETKKLGKFDDNAHAGDLRGTASKQQKPSPAGDGRLAMRTPELGRYLRPPGAAGGAARAGGGKGTQDALKDIDDGDETALNSKRWRFASFFNRIKRQVAEHWHPDEVYRQRDPTGAVYGRRNRYTELRISIKPDGNLSNVALALPSGLE